MSAGTRKHLSPALQGFDAAILSHLMPNRQCVHELCSTAAACQPTACHGSCGLEMEHLPDG